MTQTATPQVARRVGGQDLPPTEMVETEIVKLSLDDLKKACSRNKHQIVIMNMPVDEATNLLGSFLTKEMIVINAEAVLAMMFPDKAIANLKEEAMNYLSYRMAQGLMIDAIYNYKEVRQVVVVFDPNKTVQVRQGMKLEATPQLEAWLDASRRSGLVPEKIAVVASASVMPDSHVDHFFGRSPIYHV